MKRMVRLLGDALLTLRGVFFMKFLRILVITAMLNISCAHAMEELVTAATVIGKRALEIAGTVIAADAICTAITGESSALLKLGFDTETKDPILKSTFAATEFVAGIAAIHYAQ
jgi:hypothetical protein